MLNIKIPILIKKLSLEIEKQLNELLAAYDLTVSQYKILKMIYAANEPIRQVDIEKEFSLTNPTVTGIVNNLNKKALIEKIDCKNDKRSKIIVLTQKSLDMMEDLIKIGEQLEQDITKRLSKEEIKQLVNILEKMIDKEYEYI